MTANQRNGMWVIGGAVVPFVLALALLPVEDRIGPATVPLLLVVPVVVVASTGRRRAALVAAFAAAVAYDVVFTAPQGSLAIRQVEDLVITLVLLAVGFVVVQVSLWGQQQVRTANRAVSDVAIVRSVAELMALGEDEDIVLIHAATWLRELLALADCRFSWSLVPVSPARVEPEGVVAIGPVRADTVANGLPGPTTDLFLHAEGTPVARFVLTPTRGVPVFPDRLLTAAALADMVGSWLWARRPEETR